MTPSEQLVFDLCRRSALSLWSYANPRRLDGRELCDVLLVFGEEVVIFSVKEIALKEDADPEVAGKRWVREAVDKSIGQLRGASRELERMSRVTRHDGTDGIDLPPAAHRKVHLVAVAAGGKRQVPFAGGGREGGLFVHVMDEYALRAILGELDTAPDFLEYLSAKEAFSGSIVCEGEENLLAVYLHGGRKLPTDHHIMLVEDGTWRELQAKPEFKARKDADRTSYWWDRNIERFISDFDVSAEAGTSRPDHERVVRLMAAEDRFARRMLSHAFLTWLHRKEAGTRSFKSPSGVGYLFGTFPRDWERESRQVELHARCLVARSPSVLNCPTIIGLATEIYDPAGYSMDAIYLHMPEWTADDEKLAQEARQRLGIMESPRYLEASTDEYPAGVRAKTTQAEKNRRKRERRARR